MTLKNSEEPCYHKQKKTIDMLDIQVELTS